MSDDCHNGGLVCQAFFIGKERIMSYFYHIVLLRGIIVKLIYIFLLSVVIYTNNFSQTINGGNGKINKDSIAVLESQRVKFDPTRNADEDLKNAIVIADSLNKRILLDVGGEWCSWCHLLDYFFLINKDIYDLLHDNYIVVKINHSEENKNEKFLSRYPEIPGFPHIFILEKDGKLLHSQNTGELELGRGYSREKVSQLLNKWKLN